MRIDSPTRTDVLHVALRMRESDFREIGALLPVQTRGALAKLLADRYVGSDALVAKADDGEPIAVARMVEARPNIVTLGFFATDKITSIGLPLTRAVRRTFDLLKQSGIHRLECVSAVDHKDAHEWLAILGLTPEGPPMFGFGKNGEAFQSFVWVADVHKIGA